MSTFTIPNVFVSNTKIKSASVNANFTAIASTLNTNLLPAIGNTTALVTTDAGGNLQSVLPIGTDGQTLVVDVTATTTGKLKFATPSTGISQSQLTNVGLGASASGGVLTVTLKQADGVTNPGAGTGQAIIGIRSTVSTVGGFNTRSVSAPLSTVISLGSTFGMIASQNNSLWVYAVDSDGAGTIVLATSSIYNDDTLLSNIAVESAAATIDIASSTITSASHGYQNNDGVLFTTTGALPTGLTSGTRYWVINATTNTFQVTTVLGNAALSFSGTQSGLHTVHVASPRLVSTMAYTGVAIRLLGKLTVNLSSPGNWVAPVRISLSDLASTQEAISMKYTSSARQGSGSFQCQTKEYDTHGLVDSAGQFLVPPGGAGIYDIEVGYQASAVSFAAGQYSVLLPQVNGTNFGSIALWQAQVAGSSFEAYGYGSTSLVCNDRDVINLGVLTTNAGLQMDGAPDCFVVIQKRGPFGE